MLVKHWSEQKTHNLEVLGSNPRWSTYILGEQEEDVIQAGGHVIMVVGYTKKAGVYDGILS